ncbi:MAG TPA: hypothetical protein VNJ29_02895, partial [Candidatus Nitrosotenuis sp.]|nr:hypothetical protein [Candidatus Nitrosotenuis sp.]
MTGRWIWYLKLLMIVLSVLGSIKALPVHEIPGLYSQFRQGFQHFSPVNGLLILYSGILANIRFHGFYGPQKNILCHYQIVNPPEGVPSRADSDCPQDYTTAIVQQLFPSPAGGQLSRPGAKYDFFNILPFDKLGELLKTYSYLKQSHQKPFDVFHRLFKSWILEGKVLNKDGRKSLANLWSKSDKNILTRLVNDYATMFANAIGESDDYPLNFVESALLAFACQRASQSEDLKPLLKVFEEFLTPSSKKVDFSEEAYKQWKAGFLINQKISEDDFASLLKNPETLIFTTLAYELYDRHYPQMLGTGTAIHTYLGANAEQKKESFSDCGESSLRNFFNVMLADPETKSFNVIYLQNAFPTVSPKLIQFYQFQPTYNYVTNDLKLRSLWADVVSSSNQPNDPELVTYGGIGRCNIKGIGVDNMLIVLAKVLNDPHLGKPVNDQHRAHMMTYLLKKFSRDGVEFSWHVEGESTELPLFGDLTIQVNGDDQFSWQFHK